MVFDPKKSATVGVVAFLTSYVLYGYLIPISLYVSLELVKAGL
jgi:phospholipid-transporting ATPase